MELDIPYLLQCYNDYKFATTMTPSMRIDALEEDKRPSACIGCGQCMHVCLLLWRSLLKCMRRGLIGATL